jgi:hypothetical protein
LVKQIIGITHMKKILLASSFLATALLTHLSAAFANSNAASRMYVCATAQNSALDQSGYEALTWVEITGIGSRGEAGHITNVLNYPTWDTTVIQKAKGMTDAGSPELELARNPTDAGQIILRAAAAVGNNNKYAFKEVRSDGTTSTNGTVIYNRGLVLGPKRPGGRNEDFDLEVFTLAFLQEEIIVSPVASGVAPYVTVIPAITGTATVGQVLTLGNGTWAGDATITYTYAWYANNIVITGATASTYTLLAAQLGKRITGRVTATNDSGTASSTTVPTSAVS